MIFNQHVNTFLEYQKKAARIVILDGKAIKELAKDKKVTRYAFTTFFFAMFINMIIMWFLHHSLFILTFYPFAIIVAFFTVHFLARLLGSKSRAIEYFRVLGIFSLFLTVVVVNLLPIIGKYLGLLLIPIAMVIGYNIVRVVYKFSIKKTVLVAILTMIIEVVILALILILLTAFFLVLGVDLSLLVSPENSVPKF